MTISTDLLKLETDSKIFERGQQLKQENQNHPLNYKQNQHNLQITTDIKTYALKIEYNLETGLILQKKCTCKYFEKNNKTCKHLIALSLLSNHKLQKTIKNFELLDTYEKTDEILNHIIELNSQRPKQTNQIYNAKSVTQITQTIKLLLEQNPNLNNLYIKGEISNLNPNKSGHIYFSIKDEYSLLNCVMFKTSTQTLTFKPQIGDKILLKGKITLYEPKGTYQLLVKEMKKQGQGDLYQQFLDLKNKLQYEGLFNEKTKKPIPKLPQKIAIITSETGAVIQDIINTIKRRFPKLQLDLYPVSVQGQRAYQTIIKALNQTQQTKTTNYDTIIIARGGGSIEDLWNFNSEQLARTIHQIKTPIISAIGHETDFTICDFVSDLRAPTPTAAAELATPNLFDLTTQLSNNQKRIIKSLEHNLENKQIKLNTLESNIYTNFDKNLTNQKHTLNTLKEKLKLLSINSTLKRGFSLTLNQKGKTIKTTKNLKKNEKITTILNSGQLTSTINKIREK